MASISLYESEKIRETLTREQQKQIRDIYIKVAEKMANEAESLAGKDNTSSILRRQWLNDMQKKLNAEIEKIGGSVQKIITDTMTKAAQAVVDDNISFFEKHNISMKGAFQNVPAIVERVATGKLYSGDWTLTSIIFKDAKYTQKDIDIIIAEGIAGNKSSYDIAKEIEKYIDPKAKKDWDWNKVYPGTKKQVDYNAQRLARTMVSHAYQQSLVQTVKYNPFVQKIRWRSANAHGRTCKVCMDREKADDHGLGKGMYPKDKLPLDHPNGLCTFIPEIGSLDDVAERLADWSNGKPDAELDRFHEKAYQNGAEKISSKALKKSEKSGIIKIQNNNSMGQIKESMTKESDRSANGMRKSPFNTLSDAEITHLKAEIKAIGADERIFRFNGGKATGYNDDDDIINVRNNVFPDIDSLHPRDKMSERAVLAHEYYGHRAYRNTILERDSWNDEFRASYMAAKNAPNLSDDDRRYLILDAVQRAEDAGVKITYNAFMRRVVYGY